MNDVDDLSALYPSSRRTMLDSYNADWAVRLGLGSDRWFKGTAGHPLPRSPPGAELNVPRIGDVGHPEESQFVRLFRRPASSGTSRRTRSV